MAVPPPLKIGLLGAGRAAQSLHVPALLRLKDRIHVAAVHDANPAEAHKVASRFSECRIASAAQDFFDSPELDAVAILTPPSTHIHLALQAVRAGKHVLVEKPLATSSRDALELARAARTAGVCAAAGHNLRFHRLVRRAAAAVQAGTLGHLLEIATRWSSPAAPDASGGRADRTRDAGVLFDLGVHHIDLARFLGSSEFVDLSAVTESQEFDDREARASGILANGVKFTAHWNRDAQAVHIVRLNGSEASLEFSMYSAVSWMLSPVSFRRRAREFREDMYCAFAEGKAGGDSAESYRRQWLDFADAIRTGTSPGCPVEDAARNVAACEALAASRQDSTRNAAPEPGGPALSVVLGVQGTFATVRHTVRRLREQTIRDRIELVLVWASAQPRIVPAEEVDNFYSCVIEQIDAGSSVASANAAGVRRASAPVVAFAEDHCFPEPEWAEALLDAHARGYAVVGPEIVNANPGSVVSWCDYLIGYGPWMSPAAAGEAPFLPGHNSSYKRALLLECGGQLEAKLEAETVLHFELARRGHRLYVEPRARAAHLNFAQWGIWLPVQFHCGRVFAGSRAESWGVGRKLFYALASPLIPAVRLARIGREMLRPSRPRHMLPRLLPALALGLLCDGAGQMTGYLCGCGRSLQRVASFEYNRVLYIQAADRRKLEEADAQAAT